MSAKENWNIAIVRVGSNAGLIKKRDVESGFPNLNTHYFLVFNVNSLQKLKTICRWKVVVQESSWSCGPKSISKNELTRELNKMLNRG